MDYKREILKERFNSVFNSMDTELKNTFSNIEKGSEPKKEVLSFIEEYENSLDNLTDLAVELSNYKDKYSYYRSKLKNTNWLGCKKYCENLDYIDERLNVLGNFIYDDFLNKTEFTVYYALKGPKQDFILIYIKRSLNDGLLYLKGKDKLNWEETHMGYYILDVSEEYRFFLKNFNKL